MVLLVGSAAKAVFIMCIVTAPLCVLAAVLRLVATRLVGRKQSSEDWLAYLAVLIHLLYISATLHSMTASKTVKFGLIDWLLVLVFINGRDLMSLRLDELLYIGKVSRIFHSII